LEDRTLLNAGTLDSTFGTTGKVTTSFPPNTTGMAMAPAVQPDGKIVVAGTVSFVAGGPTSTSIALARYNTDGSLDNSFGNGGQVTTQVAAPASDLAAANRIALQPDGKIVIVGGIDLARYTSAGALDNTFGSGGLVSLSTPGQNLVIQPDGKIVIVGSNLERFNADGSVDASFGTGGQVTLSSPESGIALQPDGRIVVAGSFLARVNPDGSADATFGTGGKVNLTVTANDVALQADGRIVVAGSVPDPTTQGITDFAVGRFNVNGSADATFGSDGLVTTQVFDGGSANAVLIQRDDKIVTVGNAGQAAGGRTSSFALVRYNPNGSLDATFGNTSAGQTITLNPFGLGANGAALQADSKIVAVGEPPGPGPDFLVARYTADLPITDPNQKFLTQVYLDLLQRPLDPDGLSVWSDALASGATRAQVVAAIEGSQEYHAVEVQKLYGLLLSRTAEPAGLNSWVGFLDQGGTFEQLEAMILGSDEYFAGHGGGTNDGFLKAMYADVLYRLTDPGSQTWSQALASGASRTSVAVGVLGSIESDTDEVQAIYRLLLRRAADSSGLSTFTQALQQGVANDAVIAEIAGSDEYFGRL
jgi:uncharacterized delta-60 repeat protein